MKFFIQKVSGNKLILFVAFTGKIVEVVSNKYRIGTPVGTVDRLFTRNSIMTTDYTLTAPIVQTTHTLREIAGMLSQEGVEGMKKCNCKTGCVTKRCICLRSGWLCSSKCHTNLSCTNFKASDSKYPSLEGLHTNTETNET